MEEVSIEEQIEGLRPTLVGIVDQNGNQILDDNVIEQIIALLQMLNRADAEAWRFEQCDAFVAKLTSDFTTNRLNLDQLRNLMATMAEFAGAYNIDLIEQNVEKFRRRIVILFLSGITLATLQYFFPGVLSFILESAYALYLALNNLIINGILTNNDIITQINTNPSLFSAGPFLAAAAQASMNLINAAFDACASAAIICGQAVGQAVGQAASQAASQAVGQIPDCLKYAAELLAFALATRVAEPVADATGRVASAVVAAASGSHDAAIAEWIRNGGPAKFKAAMGANATVAINETKRVIREALDGMNDVYYNIQHPNERIPIRFAAPHVNTVTIYWLQQYVLKFQEESYVALTRLIRKLSTIDFENGKKIKQASIARVAQELSLDKNDQVFRELLTAYTLAVDKAKLTRTRSLPHPGDDYRQNTQVTKNPGSASQEEFVPSGPNPFKTRYELKGYPLNTIGLKMPFPGMDIKSQINLNTRLQIDLTNVGITKETRFPSSSKFANILVQNIVGMYSDEDQKSLIEIIKKTVTLIPKSNTSMSIQNIKEENTKSYLAAIENFLKDKTPTKSGGRRKSRRYKKRKSTLKRRRIRRRRLTRKGRKRRHTKRR
jgi:hypothetical protein